MHGHCKYIDLVSSKLITYIEMRNLQIHFRQQK